MFLVPTQQSHHHTLARNCASLPRAPERQFKNPSPGANLGKLLNHPMERNVSEYSQSDHISAAHYPSNQEARPASYSTSATPTSEYGAYPHSARSTSSFPEHSIRQYHPASNHNGSSAGMAQQPTTNPSIAAPSPPYPHGQYSPYAPPPPPQDMSHSYPQGAPTGMYTQPRPDWGNYGHPAGQMPHPHSVPYSHPPTSAPPGRPTQYGVQQVYSFVPIPGAQQHKRPRRRYEEIERMYKCGWNGCEKAYGTLNHLNAHVTMQSHGQKRTPEEFKEIRKEWKARKKEEDQQRKAAEEQDRQRHAQSTAVAVQAQNGNADPQATEAGQPTSSYSSRQLPPIAYGPQYPPSTGSVPPQPLSQYSNSGHMYADNYQPSPPYGGQSQQMYNQRD
ncbi:hypothetical protein GGS21DRAFT_524765 [Xylaria nigripes]|nr:hypothetical protein GGS21DRAFT_524765 [Xylaria nigripes]